MNQIAKYLSIAFIILTILFVSAVADTRDELLAADRIGQEDFDQYNLADKIQNNDFIRYENASKIACFYQRKIGNAIVEKDFINYQFDKVSGKLLKRQIHWRKDILDYLPPNLLSKEEAELLARSYTVGEVLFSTLYILSPKSDVFRFNPTPKNPCWAVRMIIDGQQVVTIIDSVTGRFLGFGVPPPYQAFSLSGPIYEQPCSESWDAWYLNAANWFNTWGFHTASVEWPTQSQVKGFFQDSSHIMFYELAHGGSYGFGSGCSGEMFEWT